MGAGSEAGGGHSLRPAVSVAASIILFAAACVHCTASPAKAGEIIEGDTSWSGHRELDGLVTVAAGAVLTIEPGTTISFRGKGAGLVVSGGLIAEGSRAEPILFLSSSPPAGEREGVALTLQKAAGPVRLAFCTFRGGGSALRAVTSRFSLEDCLFEGNTVAVHAGMKSEVAIAGSAFRENDLGIEAVMESKVDARECSFEKSGRFGALFSTGSGGRIEGSSFRGGRGIRLNQAKNLVLAGNTFSAPDAGITAEQVKHDVHLKGNRFEGGVTGIQSFNFSTPWIACNEFLEMKTAVVAARFSRPLVENNLFEGNARGIDANNKSGFPVRRNVFRKNGEAIFVDMSSYPVIRENNFDGNDRSIVLGIYMSADWEKRVGSAKISGSEARRVGSRNIGGVTGESTYPGEVDARENWWGAAATEEMNRLGPDGDVTAVEDYFDRHEVTYPGFGEGSYRLDRVVYSSWKEGEIEGIGPLQGGCVELDAGGLSPRAGDRPERLRKNAP